MKKILGIVVLGFFLITPSQADDIRDFQIDGMSLGDSALDYFSKEEIKKNTDEPWPNKKYVQFCTKGNDYEFVCIAYLKKDKKYRMQQISGEDNLNYNDCLKELKEIASNIEGLFNSAVRKERNNYKHRADKKGKSIGSDVQFIFKKGGGAKIDCMNWSEELTKKEGWTDGLSVMIASKKFIKWNRTEAYN